MRCCRIEIPSPSLRQNSSCESATERTAIASCTRSATSSDASFGAPSRPIESTSTCRYSSITAWRLRSEEHTSELQSLAYLVCRLLLEKKKSAERDVRARGPAQRRPTCTRHERA